MMIGWGIGTQVGRYIRVKGRMVRYFMICVRIGRVVGGLRVFFKVNIRRNLKVSLSEGLHHFFGGVRA